MNKYRLDGGKRLIFMVLCNTVNNCLWKIENAYIMSHFLSFFEHDFLNFFFRLLNNLFNSKWLNSCIFEQYFQSSPCNLSPYRIKRGESNNSFFIQINVDTCCLLKCS